MSRITSVRFAPLTCTSIACALFVCALSQSAAHASSLTWTITPGSGNTDGGGTWQDAAGGWNNSAGAATNWSNANPDSATFGVGVGAAGTVNLSGVVAVGDM